MAQTNIFDYSPGRLQKLMAAWQEPAYRADQILAAVWTAQANDFMLATSLPRSLRVKLKAHLDWPGPWPPIREQQDEDGTYKCLFCLHDGECIESVAIPKGRRLTFCLSTQVGCAMGCRF
ncbi:hypothetical protein JW933_01545, partial [candidate division FCPU426 bacterium]|nr:hypothetical protein [candidate division FCPU426 bacterium]